MYVAQGYNYNSQKGVVREGLVFIESKPVSAHITLDNKPRGETSARIVLPEGQHQLTLRRDKYREWRKDFSLDGGAVLYFLYPKLFPVDIRVGVTKVFPGPPAWVSQSPNRRWLVMQNDASSSLLNIVDLSKPTQEPTPYVIPTDQLRFENGKLGALKAVEWSDDNKHLLLSQTMSSGELAYVMMDRENADKTVNITNRLGLVENHEIVLFDKKYDKYFVHFEAGELTTADLKKGLSETVLLNGVVYFKPYADNLIAYVTYEGATPSEAKIYVLNNKTDKYLLRSVTRSADHKYLIDMAKYQNIWYYIVSSSANKRIDIYRNPLKRANPDNRKAIIPQMSLSLENPRYVSFSNNARFVAAQSGKQFIVYDAEQIRVFRYSSSLNIQPDQQAKWMDGHRLSVVADSKVHVFEFDGTNTQTLISSRPEFEAYFDRDYTYVYTLIAQANGKTGFEFGKLVVDKK